MKKRMAIILLTFVSISAFAGHIRVDEDIATYDIIASQMTIKYLVQLSKLQDASDKKRVLFQLEHMFQIDQYSRNYMDVPFQHDYTHDEKMYFYQVFGQRVIGVDKENTLELKLLLQHRFWITKSEFGKKASDQAWLIVQHADHDLAFQKKILAVLEDLYPTGDADPRHFAYLFDRVAINEIPVRLQRYATQGRCIEGQNRWEPFAMEAPESVDARRASMGLSSLQDYIKSFKNICR
jgi:hypothetical protein